MPTATTVPLLRRPLVAVVAALVVAWVGFAVLRSPETPSGAPPLNRKVVASFWSVPVAGGRPRLLLRTRGWQDAFPTYRRDGSILFVRPTALGQALFATSPGGAVRRLRALPVLTQLVYSQATDEIVVLRDSALYAESLSGKRRRLLAKGQVGSGVWSADGSTLAFGRQIPTATGAYRPELVVVRGRREQVFRLDGGSPGPVALSPHGDRLLFSWGLQLFLLDTHTGRRRLFANGSSGYAAWSPDGHTIAYLNGVGLVTRDVRTNRRRVLVPRSRSGWGAFSPDGRRFVYVTQKPM
jgi:Tol biopolymer transport system component